MLRLLPSLLLAGVSAAGCYDDARLLPHDLAVAADLSTALPDLATLPPDLGCGCFCVTSAAQPSAVNLTAEGALDWVHFGATMSPTPPTTPDDHKANGSGDIGALTFMGTDLGTYPNNGVPFSWTDGAPNATSPSGGSFTGIKFATAGEALSGTVNASASPRVAKVFVDTFVTRGHFEAWLEDGGQPITPTFAEDVDNTDGVPGGTTRELQIRYCGPATAQLRFRWTLAMVHPCPPADPTCGYNAALQAVAVSSW